MTAFTEDFLVNKDAIFLERVLCFADITELSVTSPLIQVEAIEAADEIKVFSIEFCEFIFFGTFNLTRALKDTADTEDIEFIINPFRFFAIVDCYLIVI